MAKSKRFVSVHDVIQNWLKTRKPDCSFVGKTRDDYMKWRRAFKTRYRKCIGPWPKKAPVRLEVLKRENKGDYTREKVIFDTCPGVSVPAYILIPKDIKKGERRPGLLAAHGHGDGKDDICGITREQGDKEKIALIEQLNYEYAIDAVRQGYVVIAPDWAPFGERKLPEGWFFVDRDPCNITDIAWRYFGRPLINQNIWDGMRAVDVLAARKDVDPRRIGVIGLSYGGTMSTHMLINDPRIKVGVVSGYISTVRGDALTDRANGNTCGAQAVPHLLMHGDIPDMLGLAIPKPVLFEMGEKETCFWYSDMKKAYAHLRRIYKAAGCPDRMDKDVHPNDHMWSGEKAWGWLAKWI